MSARGMSWLDRSRGPFRPKSQVPAELAESGGGFQNQNFGSSHLLIFCSVLVFHLALRSHIPGMYIKAEMLLTSGEKKTAINATIPECAALFLKVRNNVKTTRRLEVGSGKGDINLQSSSTMARSAELMGLVMGSGAFLSLDSSLYLRQ